MDFDRETLDLVRMGQQSPSHAVYAIERMARSAGPSPAQVAAHGTRVAQPPALAQSGQPRPMAAVPHPSPHARQPMIQPREMVADMGPIISPTQWPEVFGARNHPPSYAQTVQPMLAPDLWLVVPNIPALAPNTSSGALQLDFSLGDGIICGLRGSAQIATSDPPNNAPVGILNQVQLQLSINGQEFLTTNGAGVDWVSYSDLFGADAVQWTPCLRRVLSSDKLQVVIQNINTNDLTITPTLLIGYRRLPMPL